MINQTTDSFQKENEITITADDKMWSLGESIPLIILYKNNGTNVWTFPEPEKTWEVKLAVFQGLGEQVVPFGKIIFYKSGDLERQVIEPAEIIELKQGEVYEFSADIGKRWPELFVPGINVLRIRDYNSESILQSNEIEVQISFQKSSFSALLDILTNNEASLESKQFAIAWIKRFFSDFEYVTGDINESQSLKNQKAISEALDWWIVHKTTLRVLQQIDRLNGELPSSD